MAIETLTRDDTEISAAELQEMYDKSPSLKESKEDLEKDSEFKNEKIRKIDQRFDQAIKEGDICYADKSMLFARIEKLSPQEKQRVEQIVEEYLSKGPKSKRKFREAYEAKVEKAQKAGVINKAEAEKMKKKYRESNGKERTALDEKEFDKKLEQKKQEKKEYDKILQESPHFSKDGVMTKEAEKLFVKYKEMGEKERTRAKKKLITRIATLDKAAETCKEHYETAKHYFENGEYDIALRLMERNLRSCYRYRESSMMEEYHAWATSDIQNLKYEKGKVDEIRSTREDRDDCVKARDHENSLELSNTLVQQADRFIKTTFSGTEQAEKPRDEKWVTPFMKGLKSEAEQSDKSLRLLYEEFQEEEGEEEKQQEEAKEEIDKTLSGDAVAQVNVRALQDMVKEQDGEGERTEGMEGVEARKRAHLPARHSENLSAGGPDGQGSEETREDLKAPNTPKNLNDHSEEEEEKIDQQEITQLSEEQLGEKTVEINKEKDGHLQENEAEELLRSKATLKLKRKDQELETVEKTEKEFNTRLLEREEELLKKLEREGKISAADAQQEKKRIKTLKGGQGLAKEFTQETRKRGEIIKFQQREQGQQKVENILSRQREKEGEGAKIINLEEERKKKEERKKRMREAVRVA